MYCESLAKTNRLRTGLRGCNPVDSAPARDAHVPTGPHPSHRIHDGAAMVAAIVASGARTRHRACSVPVCLPVRSEVWGGSSTSSMTIPILLKAYFHLAKSPQKVSGRQVSGWTAQFSQIGLPWSEARVSTNYNWPGPSWGPRVLQGFLKF